MKELIKIATNEKGVQCVSARELYEGLKVQKDFSDWIKNQLENVDAVEGKDFSTLKGKTSEIGGRPSTEYILTTDIAKEICMVVGVAPRTNAETKELSKQFRRYFIEAEKKLKEITKEVKHYEKKLYDYTKSPLLMDNIPGDSLVLNFLNNSTRKETEAIINKTGIKATFFAKQLNISDSNMCSWRKNEINFNEDKINNLLKVLDTIKGVLLLE